VSLPRQLVQGPSYHSWTSAVGREDISDADSSCQTLTTCQAAVAGDYTQPLLTAMDHIHASPAQQEH